VKAVLPLSRHVGTIREPVSGPKTPEMGSPPHSTGLDFQLGVNPVSQLGEVKEYSHRDK
jgi:hypothetical protein